MVGLCGSQYTYIYIVSLYLSLSLPPSCSCSCSVPLSLAREARALFLMHTLSHTLMLKLHKVWYKEGKLFDSKDPLNDQLVRIC